MQEVLIEVPTMRRFAGIELISDRIPDESTILTFRHLLEKHGLGGQVLETVKAHISARGTTRRQGTFVDATLIPAPSFTKNKERKRDPEMYQTKKGNQWLYRCAEGFAYGIKVYAGVDKDSGLIHSVVVNAANVHDFTPAAELLHGDEEVVNGDTGYQGIAKRPEMAGNASESRVAMRPGKRRALQETVEGRLQDPIETAQAGTASACSRSTSAPRLSTHSGLSNNSSGFKKPGCAAWPITVSRSICWLP